MKRAVMTGKINMMRRLFLIIAAFGLAGCAATQPKHNTTYDRINAEMAQAAKSPSKAAQPDAVSAALLPPLKIEMPRNTAKPLEPKFDLVVNNAPARQVFMGIVSGTRYSMLVHPDVNGSISVNLKDVTVFEALNALRELYGYEYKVDGPRIFIQPLSMQTRLFQINYPTATRVGTSELRVISGSVSDSGRGGKSGNSNNNSGNSGNSGGNGNGGSNNSAVDSSHITTSTTTDFWADLASNVATMVGCKVETQPATDAQRARVTIACEAGRTVVVSPHAGMIAVRAMPLELRDVSDFLKAAQITVERQVMLEAKILEVQLNDGFQSGINWAAFRNGGNSRLSAGQLVPGTLLANTGPLIGGKRINPDGSLTGTPIASNPGSDLMSAANAAGTLFGLAFQTSNFAALLSFLETQGDVLVLSSPRIATLNNQKAVLKVGTDEFFVTEVSTNTTSTGTTTTTTPSVTVQPFFSGIALDVTPQIDEHENIILHIHPSVSQVSTVNKQIQLGTSVGTFNLPLASSSVSETDSVVRARDGEIVAIGGLMRQSSNDAHSQVPVLGDVPVVGNLFRQTVRTGQKSELVILLKPTLIRSSNNWAQDIQDSQRRIQGMDRSGSGANSEQQ